MDHFIECDLELGQLELFPSFESLPLSESLFDLPTFIPPVCIRKPYIPQKKSIINGGKQIYEQQCQQRKGKGRQVL